MVKSTSYKKHFRKKVNSLQAAVAAAGGNAAAVNQFNVSKKPTKVKTFVAIRGGRRRVNNA